jgi:phage shock protein PspC (stress-responsive transcriptional regulator)
MAVLSPFRGSAPALPLLAFPVCIIVTLLCLLFVSRPALAERIPTREALYQQQKKSVVVGVTLEAICPIAGIGAFYAGESDKATVLAILSTVSAGAAVGSALYLVHLSHQSPSGAERVLSDAESGTAWTVLVVGGVIYLLTRISGLSLAPDAVASFNADLQQRLGVPPAGPLVPFHAQATGLSLVWRF